MQARVVDGPPLSEGPCSACAQRPRPSPEMERAELSLQPGRGQRFGREARLPAPGLRAAPPSVPPTREQRSGAGSGSWRPQRGERTAHRGHRNRDRGKKGQKENTAQRLWGRWDSRGRPCKPRALRDWLSGPAARAGTKGWVSGVSTKRTGF